MGDIDGPLLCDLAAEMRHRLDSYNGGWRTMEGYTLVSVESLERWEAGMERASLLIEGPAE